MENSKEEIERFSRKVDPSKRSLFGSEQTNGLGHQYRTSFSFKPENRPSAKQTEGEINEIEGKLEELKHLMAKVDDLERQLLKSNREDNNPNKEYYLKNLREIDLKRKAIENSKLESQSRLRELLAKRDGAEGRNVFLEQFHLEKRVSIADKTREGVAGNYRSDYLNSDQQKNIPENAETNDEYLSPVKDHFTFIISEETYAKALELEKEKEEAKIRHQNLKQGTFDEERRPGHSEKLGFNCRPKMDSERPPTTHGLDNIFLQGAKTDRNSLFFGQDKNVEKEFMRNSFKSLNPPSCMIPERVIRKVGIKKDLESILAYRPFDLVKGSEVKQEYLEVSRKLVPVTQSSVSMVQSRGTLFKINKPICTASCKLTLESKGVQMAYPIYSESILRPIPSEFTNRLVPKSERDDDCDSTDSVIDSGVKINYKNLIEATRTRPGRGSLPQTNRNSNR